MGKIPNKELAQAYNATKDPAVKQMLVDFGYSSKNITQSTKNGDHSRREEGMRKGTISGNDFNAAADRWHTGLFHLKNMGPVGQKAAEAVLGVLMEGSTAGKEFVASLKKSSYTSPVMKQYIDNATKFCTEQETKVTAVSSKKEQAVAAVKQKQEAVQTKSKAASNSSARRTENRTRSYNMGGGIDHRFTENRTRGYNMGGGIDNRFTENRTPGYNMGGGIDHRFTENRTHGFNMGGGIDHRCSENRTPGFNMDGSRDRRYK